MRPGIDWRGLTALVLAAGVVAVIVIGELGAQRNPNRTVSMDEVVTISTVLGAALGAVAVYLGGAYRDPGAHRRTRPPDDRGPAPGDEDGPGHGAGG